MREWWKPGKPENLCPVPYLHPAVIGYLDALVEPEWDVLEHGAGGSTLFLEQYAATVTACEDKPEWATAIRAASQFMTVVLERSLPPEGGKLYDLVLIDGEPVETRAAWLEAICAGRLVKPGGIVILDNANRPEYAKQREALQNYASHFVTFNVNPPGHSYCVTEFYRMRGGDRGAYWI